MQCTDIINKFYDNEIAKNYVKYIGRKLNEVIIDLAQNHLVQSYKIKDLCDNDIILWENRKDKCAHITVYYDNKFYCTSQQGMKMHQVLLSYKSMLRPKYIVRLEKA